LERYLSQKRSMRIQDPSVMIPYFELHCMFPEETVPLNNVILVDNWKIANNLGVLKTYFGINDIYNFSEDNNVDDNHYRCIYQGDYDDYVLSLPLGLRVDAYKEYLDAHSNPIPLSRQEYDSPITFAHVWRKQESNYREVIGSLVSDDDYLVYSDGLGAVSMLCIEIGLSYQSEERNRIGYMAKKLRIITHDQLVNDGSKTSLFFNCVKYYDLSKIKGKILVYEEDRLFEGFESFYEVPGTGGRVWSRGDIFDRRPHFIKNFDLSTSYPMIRLKKNVPLDFKAEYYLRSVKLPIYYTDDVRVLSSNSVKIDRNEAFFVTLKKFPNAFCLKMRSNISDNVVGKKGDLKCIDGIFFIYHGPFTFVGDDYIKKVELCDYSDPYLLRDFFISDGFIVGAHPFPSKVRYVYDTTLRRRDRLIYVSEFVNRGTTYGCYKLFNEVYNVNKVVVGVESNG